MRECDWSNGEEMTAVPAAEAYVRTEDAPHLPPPPRLVGAQGWLLKNLFSSVWHAIATIIVGAFLAWLIWDMFMWAVVNATWTGENREACVREGAGACWPLVVAKMPQWIYGFYP